MADLTREQRLRLYGLFLAAVILISLSLFLTGILEDDDSLSTDIVETSLNTETENILVRDQVSSLTLSPGSNFEDSISSRIVLYKDNASENNEAFSEVCTADLEGMDSYDCTLELDEDLTTGEYSIIALSYTSGDGLIGFDSQEVKVLDEFDTGEQINVNGLETELNDLHEDSLEEGIVEYSADVSASNKNVSHPISIIYAPKDSEGDELSRSELGIDALVEGDTKSEEQSFITHSSRNLDHLILYKDLGEGREPFGVIKQEQFSIS